MEGFIREDADGPYLRCTALLIEDGEGRFCGGKQRIKGDRWVCERCEAVTAVPDRVRADGGEPRFGPDRHTPVVDVPPEDAPTYERVAAAVDLACAAHERGDDPRLAAEWALGQVGLDAAWLVGVHQRVLERLDEGGEGS